MPVEFWADCKTSVSSVAMSRRKPSCLTIVAGVKCYRELLYNAISMSVEAVDYK